MNRNDVIKGLECCIWKEENGKCEQCPYHIALCVNKDAYQLKTDALEYIHRSEEARKMLVEKGDEMLQTLKDLPDVVRCGDCRKRSDGGFCSDLELFVGTEFFCANGKRKDSE